MNQKKGQNYPPAKIYLNDKKRVNMRTVKVGDYFFVDPPGRQGSVHCIVSSINRQGKITINFSEVGSDPNRFVGNNRQKEIKRIALYPQ